jgi:hypothetical protein
MNKKGERNVLRNRFRLPLLAVIFGLGLCAQGQTGVRILLGLTDKTSTRWDGSVSVQGGSVSRIDPWRFTPDDEIHQDNSWRVATHPILIDWDSWTDSPPFADNGVIIWLTGESPDTQLSVKTARGDFSLRLGDLSFGRFQYELAGRVALDRIPASWQLTNTPEEEDYPAAAVASNGDIWLAYLQMQHNPNHNQIRAPYTTVPKDLSPLSEPPKGDQILVKHFSGNQWSEPIAITPQGGDLYRPAIAVDGKGRPWVFWSDNRSRKGIYELYGRVLENGQPGQTVTISKASGSDVFPAAASDAQGRVWVAWQGWRDGKAAIFSATEQGNAFSPPQPVSSSAANEWNPAVAADSRGSVSVAWDSYRNGSYDVYVRTATAPDVWGTEVPVAATARYEAYPSIAYDPQGVLWIAYEEGAEGWGRDYGAYKTDGVPLYQARAVRLVGLNSSGRLIDPGVDPGTVLPGVGDLREDNPSRQSDVTGWEKPDPSAVSRRPQDVDSLGSQNVRNSLPRLQTDASGRLWLAFRSMSPVVWSVLGTSWSEYVTSFDGKTWTNPAYLFRSDNTLDNRPALVSRRPGDLVVIHSSDSRREVERGLAKGWTAAVWDGYGFPDPYNNDLYASVLALPPASAPIAGRDLGPPPPPVVPKTSQPDGSDLAQIRNYRISASGQNLQILRGEFHRHSELSFDGGHDGSIIDQWRYILDVASLDWVGCCDHSNGSGREYSWWTTQKLTDIFNAPGKFAAMFNYERSIEYPEGHRNVVFAQRGIRPLPRLPKVDVDSTGHAPDTQNYYVYLKKYNGVTAAHTSATDMGTDWRDNDPDAEPVVEIYQGMRQNYEIADAPRSPNEKDSIGGWRPKGFVNLALEKGYKLGFQSSSDHVSTHISYASVLATGTTREAVLEALKKRHVYAATDNIIADVRSGSHIIGDAFSTSEAPELSVKLLGTAPFAKVVIVKDSQYVYSTQPGTKDVEFSWRDYAARPGKTSYYYVRAEQENGDLVWASPFWITYTGK